MKTVIALGDVHFPYEQKNIVEQIVKYVALKKPHYIVQMGDLYDFYTASKYAKLLSITTPSEEIAKGYAAAKDFWAAIKKASPKSKCYQIKGNHDDRPFKRLLEKAPELEPFFGPTLKALFEFKGVTTVHSSRDELELDTCAGRVLFHHGHRAKLGDHMIYNEQSTVNGHSHVGGVVFKGYGDGNKTRFELNCGYSGDPKQGPLQYGEQKRKYWTFGLGEIDQFGPRFIPLPIRKGKKK